MRWVGATEGDEALVVRCGCVRVELVKWGASEVETETTGSVSLFLFADEEMVERLETTVVRRVSSWAWLDPLSVEHVELRLLSVACMLMDVL